MSANDTLLFRPPSDEVRIPSREMGLLLYLLSLMQTKASGKAGNPPVRK